MIDAHAQPATAMALDDPASSTIKGNIAHLDDAINKLCMVAVASPTIRAQIEEIEETKAQYVE